MTDPHIRIFGMIGWLCCTALILAYSLNHLTLVTIIEIVITTSAGLSLLAVKPLHRDD